MVSEDEDFVASLEALDNLKECIPQRKLYTKSCMFSIYKKNPKQKIMLTCLTVSASKSQQKKEEAKKRLCCIFPGSMMGIKKQIDIILKEEMDKLLTSRRMKKVI